MKATVGQHLVNSRLPEELKDYNRVLDKDEASVIFSYLAKYKPDEYLDIADYLNRLGADVSYYEGTTLRPSDILAPFDKKPILAELKLKEAEINIDPTLNPKQRKAKLEDLYSRYQNKLEKLTYEAALNKDNAFAKQVESKSRGSKSQLLNLLTTPATYRDSRGNMIPVFIENSLSEGLEPHEQWAASYGGRLGVICLAGDTLVLLSNGSKKQLKDIIPGDVVFSSDLDGNQKPSKVLALHKNGVMPVFEYKFKSKTDSFKVRCTKSHKFLVEHNSKRELRAISRCYSADIKFVNTVDNYILVESKFIGYLNTYDLEIEDPGHKYVLANGLISENSTKFCITEGQAIELYDGSKRMIEDIVEGDQVYTVDPNSLVKQCVDVLEVFDNGPRECFKYVFETEDRRITLKATKEHRVLVVNRFGLYRMARLEELKIDDDNLKVILAKELEQDQDIVLDLVDIIPCGKQNTYDIGVDHYSHRYVMESGIVVSNSTRQAGYLGKLLAAAAIDQLVTEDDCETLNGIPVSVDDNDNVGAVLAIPTNNYGAGTVVTKEVLSDLKNADIDEIVVRSPTTCEATKGVCKYCVGKRETGDFPPLGYNAGVNAASAFAERIAQGALDTKHCLSASSRVLYGDWSSKPIKDVEVGDVVMGCSKAGVMKPVKVLSVFDNGPRECYRTTFIKNGTHHDTDEQYVLESTLDHKILSTRQVTNSTEEYLNFVSRILPVGKKSKYFYAVTPKEFQDYRSSDEPRAMILGCLLGDGCYVESVGGVHFSCADLEQLEDMQKILESFNCKLVKLMGHDYYYRISKNHVVNGNSEPNDIKSYLKYAGLYGKYAYEKVLPLGIAKWNNESVANLIGGLVVTDGSIFNSNSSGKPGISFCSTSRLLVEQVQYLLFMRFGILTTNITCINKAGKPITSLHHEKEYFNIRDQYQFTITNWQSVQKFYNKIPLIGCKKRKFKEFMTNYGGPKQVNYLGLKRIKQEFIGVLPTYDIEVDHEDHLFVLENGLIVSNSGKKRAGKTTYSGFDVIKNLATAPKQFEHEATVAEIDGKVESIEEAPQGGWYITIGDQKHYIHPDLGPKVKPGDIVEAGDALNEGIPAPADVVRLKGIGEGRRYFAERFTDAVKDTGLKAHRRNAEVLARSIIDHLKIDELQDSENGLPGEVVNYSGWAKQYTPRKGHEVLDPDSAKNKYLEQPALHYSIGTRVTPSVAKKLKKHGIQEIDVYDKPPNVSPYMVGVAKTPEYKNDWVARLGSSYLKERLSEDIRKGSFSDVHGVHPLPGVAKGVTFGNPRPGEVGY